jgi:hypothetical protein
MKAKVGTRDVLSKEEKIQGILITFFFQLFKDFQEGKYDLSCVRP